MHKKEKKLIVTFSTTTDAMKMEKHCAKHQIPGRMIPVPREISAGCGLAWRAEPEEEENITKELERSGLKWETMQIAELDTIVFGGEKIK